MKERLLTIVLGVSIAFAATSVAVAQASNDETTQKTHAVKADDLGLRNTILPDDLRKDLKLTSSQRSRIAAADKRTNAEVAKLNKQLKSLGSHQHGMGEECPHCALNAKIRKACADYQQALVKILNDSQKDIVRKAMAKREKDPS